MTRWMHSVIENRSPMDPIETGWEAKLEPLKTVKAVIFDIYGTLLISGTGDVGSADVSTKEHLIRDAVEAAGIRTDEQNVPTTAQLHDAIRDQNGRCLSADRPKPEVDIVAIWRSVLHQNGILASTRQTNQLAAEYESRMNATWPMPGAASLLSGLAECGLKLGIVSNAQQFTIPLIEELGGNFGVDSLFDPNLCVFSYRYRQAKPAARLFDVLCVGLDRLGILPLDALYVGNDRLNDVWAASRAGLRTAWFAGDKRSLRARDDDERLQGLPHDLILTRLDQLATCF